MRRGRYPDPRRLPDWWRGKAGQRVHIAAVGLFTAAVAAVYATYVLIRFSSGNTGLLDLGIFDQAVRGYAHFSNPDSIVLGMPDPSGAGRSQLSDHFTPLLALFAPLYWIHDAPTTLLVGGAVLVASAIPPLWILTRRALGPTAAYLVVAAYAVCWENQWQLWFGFHEVAFVAPIAAWMFERAQVGKRRQAAAISLLLLFVKDDMGFLVAGFGIYLLFSQGFSRSTWLRKDRLLGTAGLVAGGFAMVVLVNKVILPAFGGSSERNWTYNHFGRSPGEMLGYMLEHPFATWRYLIGSPYKTETLHWLFGSLLFLPLLSPISLLVVPLLVERFLSDNINYWGTGFQYNSFLTVVLFAAGVDGASRLTRWTRRIPQAGRHTQRLGLVWALGTAVLAVHVLSAWPMWEMTTSAWWHSPDKPSAVAARAAASHVPDGALVAAPGDAGVFLLDRTRVFLWSFPGDRTPLDRPPWLVANVKDWAYPYTSLKDQQARVDLLLRTGYTLVFEQDGYAVLHKL